MQTTGLPEGFLWADALDLGEETAHLTRTLWPGYLSEESDLPEPGLSFEIDADELALRFPNWGIRRASDQKLVAHLSAALISEDLAKTSFPDTGWQYAIQAAYSADVPNCM